MTIEEAKAKKKVLEEEIRDKLNAFKHETGLGIESIAIEYRPMTYEGKNVDIVRVILDVRI